MLLERYLIENAISRGEFARRIGAKNARTVSRYIQGARMPDQKMMAKIFEVTGGEVRPDDFYPQMKAA